MSLSFFQLFSSLTWIKQTSSLDKKCFLLSLTCDAFANLICSCIPLRTGTVWMKIAVGFLYTAAVRRSCWQRFNQLDALPQGSNEHYGIVPASKIHGKNILSTRYSCKAFCMFSFFCSLCSEVLLTFSLVMWNIM